MSVLYRIEGFTDLWADACLRNDEGQLQFLSFYGRDTSCMQFIAAMELGAKEGGVRRFTLAAENGSSHGVEVGSTERLGKFSGRLPRQNLFGPLSQMWVYDRCLQEIDKAHRIGWVVHQQGQGEDVGIDAKVWELLKQLSPVALLDHWCDPLMTWCHAQRAVAEVGSERYPPIGPIRAVRVSLSEHFVRFVSDSVRNRTLTL